MARKVVSISSSRRVIHPESLSTRSIRRNQHVLLLERGTVIIVCILLCCAFSPLEVTGSVTTGKGDVGDCRTGVRRIFSKIGMKDGPNPADFVKRSSKFIKQLCSGSASNGGSVSQNDEEDEDDSD